MIDDPDKNTEYPTLRTQRICEEMGLDGPQYESVREMVWQVLYAADFGFERCEIEKRQVWHVAPKFHEAPEYWVRPGLYSDWKFVLHLCGPDDVTLKNETAEWHFPEATSKKLIAAVEAAWHDVY